MTSQIEEWRPILDWPDYEVSSLGRVRSFTRIVPYANGRACTHHGRILKAWATPPPYGGYRRVHLYRLGGRRGKRVVKEVHCLVVAAFRGPRPPDLVVRHLDGNPGNNTVENLVYGTPSENGYDAIRHGRNHGANQTHCLRKHRLAPPNLMQPRRRESRRRCLACSRALAYCSYHKRDDLQEVSDSYYEAIMSEVAA